MDAAIDLRCSFSLPNFLPKYSLIFKAQLGFYLLWEIFSACPRAQGPWPPSPVPALMSILVYLTAIHSQIFIYVYFFQSCFVCILSFSYIGHPGRAHVISYCFFLCLAKQCICQYNRCSYTINFILCHLAGTFQLESSFLMPFLWVSSVLFRSVSPGICNTLGPLCPSEYILYRHGGV